MSQVKAIHVYDFDNTCEHAMLPVGMIMDSAADCFSVLKSASQPTALERTDDRFSAGVGEFRKRGMVARSEPADSDGRWARKGRVARMERVVE